jgi:dihydropteroate synthase
MARQGADWIDVGGESTRPGSKPTPAAEELDRVLPVIRGLHRRSRGLVISIDTTKAEVAREAVGAGATIINDVSGLRFDAGIARVALRARAALILMHLRGRPETMQQRPFARSIARSLGRGMVWSIRRAAALGVRRSQLLIDPGLGFGKTRRQNFEILAALGRLRRFGLPLVVGSSRKSFVQAVACGEGLEPARRASGKPGPWRLTVEARHSGEEEPPDLLAGDAAAIAAAVLGGAHVVRVHNVPAALAAVRIADAILESARERALQ